jgi:hypothetical protein
MSRICVPHPQPWVICRLGADPARQIVRRYLRRNDAEADLAFIQGINQPGLYLIAFDVIEVESDDET